MEFFFLTVSFHLWGKTLLWKFQKSKHLQKRLACRLWNTRRLHWYGLTYNMQIRCRHVLYDSPPFAHANPQNAAGYLQRTRQLEAAVCKFRLGCVANGSNEAVWEFTSRHSGHWQWRGSLVVKQTRMHKHLSVWKVSFFVMPKKTKALTNVDFQFVFAHVFTVIDQKMKWQNMLQVLRNIAYFTVRFQSPNPCVLDNCAL